MKILMVCLGNICRSPMAHGFMEECIRRNNLNWIVDSAGTNGFHDGEAPDPRAILEMKQYGIDISKQISRKVRLKDLETFDWILAMDHQNVKNLKNLSSDQRNHSKIVTLLEYAGSEDRQEVPDPYYDGRFKEIAMLIKGACEKIIERNQ